MARQSSGSLKKPMPTERLTTFMKAVGDVRRDTATAGAKTAASIRRGLSFGNGAVGDKALVLVKLTILICIVKLTWQTFPSHQICPQSRAL